VRKKALLLLAGSLFASQWAYADNIIRFSAPIAESVGVWKVIADQESGWQDVGASYACSNWAPLANTVISGQTFVQTATDCLQAHEKTIQARKQNTKTHEIKNVGAPVRISEIYMVQNTRNALGTYTGTWSAISSLVSGWTNVGMPGSCTNWTPNANTVLQGTTFTQTATDCVQLQEQTIQAREQNTLTSVIRNVGSPQVSQKTIAATSTQDAIGTKLSDWQPSTPLVSGWTEQSSTGCSLAPASATLQPGLVTQSRNCSSVVQTRTTQQREYNQALGTYRDVGAPVVEQKTTSGIAESRNLSCLYSMYSSNWATNIGSSAAYAATKYAGQDVLGKMDNVTLEKKSVSDGFLYIRGAYREYTGGYWSEDKKELYVICRVLPAP
jgi:hypothetical protein